MCESSNESGFGLIELMVASLILLIGVLGTAGAMGSSVIGTKNSQLP
jgi:prepilin-type N-terminal cleavage/methylation domain-containing protein